MRFNLFYTFKFLRKNVLLTIITVLSITFSGLILIASTNMSNYVRCVQNQMVENTYGDYDVSLVADYESDASFASILGIIELEEYYDEYISGFKSIASVNINGGMFDIDLLSLEHSSLESLTNNEYNKYGFGDVVISKYLANKLNLKIHDKVVINHYGYEMDMYVSQIVDNDSIFSNNAELSTIVISPDTFSKLFPIYNKYLFNFALFKSDNIDFISVLEQRYPLFTTTDINDNYMVNMISNSSEVYVISITTAAIIVCLFISYTMFQYFDEHNNKELLKLSKLGVNNRDVTIIKFLQNIFISTLCILFILILSSCLIPILNVIYGVNFVLPFSTYILVFLYTYISPILLYGLKEFNNKRGLSNKMIVTINIGLVSLYGLFSFIDSYITSILCFIIIYIMVFTLPKLVNLILTSCFKVKNCITGIVCKVEKCSLMSLLTISFMLTFSMSFYQGISDTNLLILSNKNDITISNFSNNLDCKEIFKEYDATYIYEKNHIKIDGYNIEMMYGVDDISVVLDKFNLNISNNSSLNYNEILVSSYYRDILNYNIGDIIDVEINGISNDFSISGFINDNVYYSSCVFMDFSSVKLFNIVNYNKVVIHECTNSGYINVLLSENGVYARVFNGTTQVNENYFKNVFLVDVISIFIIILISIEVLFVFILRNKNMSKENGIFKMLGCNNNVLLSINITLCLFKVVISIGISALLIFLASFNLYDIFLYNDVYLYLRLDNSFNKFTFLLLFLSIIVGLLFNLIKYKKIKK